MRKERMFLSLDPVVDQRFDGILQEAVEQDQDRHALILHLQRQVTNSSKKQELLDELKKIIKERGNVETFDLLELSKNQCKHCDKYKPCGHVDCHCYCGRTSVYANRNHVT